MEEKLSSGGIRENERKADKEEAPCPSPCICGGGYGEDGEEETIIICHGPAVNIT